MSWTSGDVLSLVQTMGPHGRVGLPIDQWSEVASGDVVAAMSAEQRLMTAPCVAGAIGADIDAATAAHEALAATDPAGRARLLPVDGTRDTTSSGEGATVERQFWRRCAAGLTVRATAIVVGVGLVLSGGARVLVSDSAPAGPRPVFSGSTARPSHFRTVACSVYRLLVHRP